MKKLQKVIRYIKREITDNNKNDTDSQIYAVMCQVVSFRISLVSFGDVRTTSPF